MNVEFLSFFYILLQDEQVSSDLYLKNCCVENSMLALLLVYSHILRDM